jgi:Type II secretion system (T2SS), protein M subtype b
MRWSTMTSRERRAIVMGAGVVLAGFAVIWGRMYRDALGSARDELATERATLARERVAVATARHNPQLQHIADSAMRAMRPRLFEGKDDVMASSELASYVGDVARRARVWLQDAGTRPATPAAEGVRTLRVEIRAESDLQGALLFLQGLERGDKLVRIDRLDISHAARSDEKDSEVLSIAATISGFAVSDSMTTASLAHPTVASVSSIVEVPR